MDELDFFKIPVTGPEALEFFHGTFWMLCCFTIVKTLIFMLRKFWRQWLVLIGIILG
jgi:hypothetical protein